MNIFAVCVSEKKKELWFTLLGELEAKIAPINTQ